MLIYWPGNEYCWTKEALCRNAGCSKLYIVHLLDSFAIIALQHNSGTLEERVSALHYTPTILNLWLLITHKWKEMERAPSGHRVHADGVVVFIKKPWLCHSPWRCSFFRTAEWQRGLKFPPRLSSPSGDEGR